MRKGKARRTERPGGPFASVHGPREDASGGDVYPDAVSALAWWLIPIGVTALAILFVVLRNRPARPTRTADGIQSMKEMRRAMRRPHPGQQAPGPRSGDGDVTR